MLIRTRLPKTVPTGAVVLMDADSNTASRHNRSRLEAEWGIEVYLEMLLVARRTRQTELPTTIDLAIGSLAADLDRHRHLRRVIWLVTIAWLHHYTFQRG